MKSVCRFIPEVASGAGAKIEMKTCKVFGDDSTQLPQPERTLVFDVFRFDRFVSIPKIKNGGDDNSNAQAAEKEPAVGRKPDQQDKHQGSPRRSDLLRLAGSFWDVPAQDSVPRECPVHHFIFFSSYRAGCVLPKSF